MKKTAPTRRVRSDAIQADPDPYKPARRPARAAPATRGERPARSFDRSERPTRSPRPPRESDSAPRYGARRFGGSEERGGERGGFDRGGSGFTVNLDSDVARVFRGDASVNKALRLVMQLMQVVQGPPPREGGRFGADRPRSSGGYRGSAEARGFERKPRFEASDDDDE